VYLEPRLWAFTAGVRGRIAATVLVGLAAVAAGIARLALLGWLLGRVVLGEPLAELVPAIVLTAVALGARSALDYARTMVAHHTAARVQAELRRTLYAKVADLSLRLDRKLQWNWGAESIMGDREAAALLARPYRPPWDAELRALGVG